MFKKSKPPKQTKSEQSYTYFEDFIQMMLTCSDEQFKSICAWLEIMRNKKQ